MLGQNRVIQVPKTEKKDKQDRMIELLEEMLKWIKVTSIPHVKKLLLEILPSDEEKIKAVAKFAGVSYVTVTKWWKIWGRAGLAEMMSAKGGERAKRIFSLDDFGIEVPKIVKAAPKTANRGEMASDKQESDVGTS